MEGGLWREELHRKGRRGGVGMGAVPSFIHIGKESPTVWWVLNEWQLLSF
jgi:hypothetical protein